MTCTFELVSGKLMLSQKKKKKTETTHLIEPTCNPCWCNTGKN